MKINKNVMKKAGIGLVATTILATAGIYSYNQFVSVSAENDATQVETLPDLRPTKGYDDVVKEDAKQSIGDVEAYIRDHVNKDYVSGDVATSLEMKDIIPIKQTLVDSSKLPEGATIDSIIAQDVETLDLESDPFLLNVDHIMGLYDVGESDYYVGLANTMIDTDGSTIVDWQGALNSVKGETVDDIIYDNNTGLVYVPKKYTDKSKELSSDENNTGVAAVQLQLLNAVSTTGKTSADLTFKRANVKGLMDDGKVEGNIVSTDTRVKITDNAELASKLTVDNFKVSVNGSEYAHEYLEYDSETGYLIIPQMLLSIADIDIEMVNTDNLYDTGFLSGVTTFFSSLFGQGEDVKAVSKSAAETAPGSVWKFEDVPKTGAGRVNFDSTYNYDEDNVYGNGAQTQGLYQPGGYGDTDQAAKTLFNSVLSGSGTLNVSDMQKAVGIHSVYIRGNQGQTYNVGGTSLRFDATSQYKLTCIHVSSPLGKGDPASLYAQTGDPWEKNTVVAYRIYEVVKETENSGYMLIGFSSRQYTSQSGAGLYKIRWESPVKEGYLKAKKEFSNLNQDLNTKPSWDPNGIKIGVYNDVNATNKLYDLTVGSNGETNTQKVKPGKYYGFELDVNGNPIKSVASEVVNGTAANRGYVSGSDKKDTSKPYIVWDVKAENTASNPDVETFVNTPEVVNFTFSKEIASDSIKALEAIDPQYTRVGAVYTLYKDAGATEPVIRDGQNVTATIGADGTAEFSNLYRGVYYVKETAVPTFVKNGRTVKRFALDPKVHKVDLSTMNDNETNTGDSTIITTKEFKQVGSFTSLEDKPGNNNGSLVIKKKDADTKSNTAQGQATLQGAEFKVEFYEMTTLGTGAPVKKWETVYKTDAKGEIDVRNRNLMVSTTNADAMNKLFTAYEQDKEWGAYDYRVTETKAPNGYKLGTPESKDFVVKNLDNYEANNFVWTYDDASIYNDDLEIQLIKTQRSSGDWLTDSKAKSVVIKNAMFTLTNKTSGESFTATTDDKGKLQFDGVIEGEYTLKETSVEDYKTNGQTIEISVKRQDGTTKLVASSTSVETDDNGAFNITETLNKDILVDFENTAKEASAKLIKTNEKGAKLEGATFKLIEYTEDGTQVVSEKEITTNANGELDFSDITVGKWYSIEEVKAPQGYKLPEVRTRLNFRVESIPAQQSFQISYWTYNVDKVNENNTTPEISNVKTLTVENTVQDGILFDAVDTDSNGKNDTMILEFDFVNNTWKKLPATGSNFGLIAGVAVVAIVIGSAVFYVKKREA